MRRVGRERNTRQTLPVPRVKERNGRGLEIRLENYGLFARISENLRGVRGVMVSHPGRGQCLLRFVREEAEKPLQADAAQAGASPQTLDGSCREGRYAMSAALTLPYVWATAAEPLPQPAPDVAPMSAEVPANGVIFYRRRTESLLRRYLRASMAVGRVPAFAQEVSQRGRATSCRMKSFEDVVIFTIDVEKCLKRLDKEDLQLVVKIALQEYMYLEVAAQLGQDVRTVVGNYGKALDRLTVEFLHKKLLDLES